MEDLVQYSVLRMASLTLPTAESMAGQVINFCPTKATLVGMPQMDPKAKAHSHRMVLSFIRSVGTRRACNHAPDYLFDAANRRA